MPIDKERFQRLAKDFSVIPVTREVFADLDTPVTCFWKLRQGAWNFLLESVEGGERWARYTSMGTQPRHVFRMKCGELNVQAADGTQQTWKTEDPFRMVLDHYQDQRVYHDVDLPRFAQGIVGAVAYDAVRGMERIGESLPPDPSLDDFCLMETGLVLVWDNLKHRAVLIYHCAVAEDVDHAWRHAQEKLDEAAEKIARPLPPFPPFTNPESVTITPSATHEEFSELVAKAKHYIEAGDVIQLVISRSFKQPSHGMHPFYVYRALRQLNPSPYMFYLELGETTMVGASPEVLVRVTDKKIENRPIAGTRPRGHTREEDEALAQELIADSKERAEHVMLVDLGRNDVGRVASTGSVRVEEWMCVERYSHVMHLVSHVTGQLRPDKGPSEVLHAAFPAGTLTGAPKVRAMQLIESLEAHRRGYYGGAVGMFGPAGDLDLCITIRTLIAHSGTFTAQAGAGIVFDSVPEKEADETWDKANAALSAVTLARGLFAGDPR